MSKFAWVLVLFATVTLHAASETRPTTAPVAPADAPASTPKETLHSLNIAQRDGDAAAIRSLFTATDPEGEKLVAAMADYAAALTALHAAAEKAYGLEGANKVTGDLQDESAKGLAAIEKADVALDANTASVKYAGATDDPIKLEKIDGRWKLPVTQLLDGADAKAEARGTAALLFQSHVTRAIADEINAGRYHESPTLARDAWRSRLLDTSGNPIKPDAPQTQPAR